MFQIKLLLNRRATVRLARLFGVPTIFLAVATGAFAHERSIIASPVSITCTSNINGLSLASSAWWGTVGPHLLSTRASLILTTSHKSPAIFGLDHSGAAISIEYALNTPKNNSKTQQSEKAFKKPTKSRNSIGYYPKMWC